MKKIVFSDIERENIINKYLSKEKTMRELAVDYNCSWSVIYRFLKENNVKINKTFKKRNLSGNRYGQLLVIEINQDRYNKELLKTKKPHIYWKCVCDCGNYTEVESSHLLNGHTQSCGCVKSLGEQRIAKLLKANNISFSTEVYFNDLRGYGNGLLRFDFAIIKNNKVSYLIEFNGKQHYKRTNGWNTENEFQIRKYNDNQKIIYCKQKNIPLIIIPYTQLNKLNINDLILDRTNFLIKGEKYENLA